MHEPEGPPSRSHREPTDAGGPAIRSLVEDVPTSTPNGAEHEDDDSFPRGPLPASIPIEVSAAERERLENCVREPIRRPGAVQPHGVLLAVDRAGWVVVQVSGNVGAVLGTTAENVLGAPVAELFGADAVERLSAVLAAVRGVSNPVLVEVGGNGFDAIVHEVDGVVVVELEPVLPAERFAAVPAVYGAVARLSTPASREQLWADAAREFQELTGFERVMIYHFHPDGHGQIVAEERSDETLESYLGLHYPASDIPAQARELYLSKLSRTIFSSDDLAYPLLSAEGANVGEPLDLGGAELRSVSPHHLEFMRNMGLASSLSFSLVAGGKLIGMVTCAHRTSLRLPYLLRQSLEVLAQQVAVHLDAMSTIDALRRAGELLATRMHLIEQLSLSEGTAPALLNGPVTLLELVPAAGAAIHSDGHTSTIGDAPDADAIERLLAQLHAGEIGLPFASHALPLEHPELSAIIPSVGGLLIVPFDRGEGGLFWFRPEMTRTTRWLGDQTEANRDSTLSPRNSFSAWRSSVSGRAQPWGDLEQEAVEFGRNLDSAILRSAESDLAHLGLHDELTGLPNRRLLLDRVEHALAGAGRGTEVSLLFLDLDSFKDINDTLGHEQGDAVLTEVAARLLSVTRAVDTVARLGGDEFVILCESTDRQAATIVAGRVLTAVSSPLATDGPSLRMTASVGIATAQGGDSVADLLRRADAAMYRAKRSGKNRAAH